MKRARKQFFSGSESRQDLAAASSDEGTPLALKTNAATDSLRANDATVITSLGQRPRIPGRKTNAATDALSANGATVITSLGQRPRVSYNAKPKALKARFFLEMCS
jgi:hypothetical protein